MLDLSEQQRMRKEIENYMSGWTRAQKLTKTRRQMLKEVVTVEELAGPPTT